MRAVLLVALLLSACASRGDDVVAQRPATELRIELVRAPGAAPVRWVLTCSPSGGDHPDAAAACRDLAQEPEPFAPVASDAACAQLYGGPETAVVRGTLAGRPVSLALSRTDGCRIAQWERLGAVLAPTP